MRELVSLSSEQQARRFAAYLAVEAIQSVVEEDDGEWIVWIHHDDDREKAAAFLEEFRANPDDQKYENAERKVRHVLKEADRLQREGRKKQIDLKKRWSGSWWHCHPATQIMFGICITICIVCTTWSPYEASSFGAPRLCNNDESVILQNMWILSAKDGPVDAVYTDARRTVWAEVHLEKFRRMQQNGTPQPLSFMEVRLINARSAWAGFQAMIMSGKVWQLVTPIFIHLDCLHILFNMMWMRSLGSAIEYVRGTRRFVLLCLILALTSNLTQLFWTGPYFGGMSGVVFGLIGYVWMKGKTEPRQGLGLMSQTVVYCFLWLLLCMSGALGPIANAAHLGGFAVGIIIGSRKAIWKSLPFSKVGRDTRT